MFSIIVPARNEADFLQATLDAIKNQITDVPFEILVVDNGSVDSTAEVAKKAGVPVIYEPIAGLPQARERGRLAAQGEYLIYVDGDTILPPNYVEEMHRALAKNPSAVGATNPVWFYDGNFRQNSLVYFYFGLIYRVQTIGLKLSGGSNQLIGGSFAASAGALAKIGGFNTHIKFWGEDTEISKRLGRLGKIIFLPQLRVATSARRFQINGTIKTAWTYVRNYFSVAFFNQESNNQLIRGLLKLIFLVATTILVDRLFFHHYTHLVHRIPTYAVRELTSQLHQHELVLTIILLGVLLIGLYAMIEPRSELFGPVLSRLNTNEKLVALTFDDGPVPGSTEKILAILDGYKIQATFFMIGQRAAAHPKIVRAVDHAGHGLGIHSYTHGWLLPFHTRHFILEDLRRTRQAIERSTETHQPVKLYRPPHGWRTPAMLKAVKQSGYEAVLWDAITLDFREEFHAKNITSRLLKQTRPGSIIVLHDGVAENVHAKRDNLIQALPNLIDGLQQAGYRFVRVQDLL